MTDKPIVTRRRFLASTLAGSMFAPLAISGVAQAQNYPTQPVRIIVPFGAGGPIDMVGRPLAQYFTQAFGGSFVVDNRPGANGIIGTNAVAKAAPDGHMMLITTGSFSANPSLNKSLPYDPMKDLEPVSLLAESYGLLLMVPANSPIKSLKDLVDTAKKQPGKLNYAITGLGNITHVTMEYFKHIAGIDVTPVPYKGTADSITAMLTGEVQMSIVSTTAGAPQLASGKLRALGISGARRAPNLPDIPTFQELGYKEMNLTGYYGLWMTGGTPRALIERMSAEARKALKTDDLQKFLKNSGLNEVGSTPDEFRKFLVQDIAFQREVFQRIGLKPK
jgi:tripartite-type tricarboxylate transporter receptor subunit TctC